MSELYILTEQKEVKRAKNIKEWSEYLQSSNNRVANDLVGSYRVSTVFLGVDHAFGDGPPLVFETMIFPEDSYKDLYCERYSTYEEAVAGHKRVVNTKDIKTLFYDYDKEENN